MVQLVSIRMFGIEVAGAGMVAGLACRKKD